jgi:transketolase
MKKIVVKESKATRAGFGAGLHELGKTNEDVVALSADLSGSLKMTEFINDFPHRFYQCGIAEANMMGMAAGLTIGGKIPFVASFANFVTGRVYDQIRQSVCYSNKNVKICASHAGLTLGEDGASHQILEDMGLMKMLPKMTVINPADYNQTKAATLAIAENYGPTYLRFGRPKVPNFTSETEKFEIGKAILMQEGSDVTIIATGHLLFTAIKAAELLSEKGISAEVVNIHTIKPLDEEAILESTSKTKAVVTAEEHLRNGGLGDSIAQLLSRKNPLPIEMVAVDNTFGESGKPTELLKKYNIDLPDIVNAAERVIERKENQNSKYVISSAS